MRCRYLSSSGRCGCLPEPRRAVISSRISRGKGPAGYGEYVLVRVFFYAMKKKKEKTLNEPCTFLAHISIAA